MATGGFSDRRILVTGPAGQIAFPIVRALAVDNEVWGIARFTGGGSRERVEATGCRTAVVDLAEPDWSGLPDHFDHVVHLAAFIIGACSCRGSPPPGRCW
jgi:nucleoside-diphosphate-sugar epimerase